MRYKNMGLLGIIVTWIAAVLFASLLVLLFVQVVLRYGFNSGFSWIEEYSTFCFVWMSLLGIALGVRYKTHLSMDAVVELLPAKLKKVSNVLNKILCIVFYGMLMYSGILYTKVGQVLTSPLLKLKYAVMYVSIPVMCCLSIFFLLIDLIFSDKKNADRRETK